MYKIYSDYHALCEMKTVNGSLGNKILHILFVIYLAANKKRSPVFYEDSNINYIFDFRHEFIEKYPKIKKTYFFEEREPYWHQNFLLKSLRKSNRFQNNNLMSVIDNSKKFNLENHNLLHKGSLPFKDIMIKGWFFDYNLMPSLEMTRQYFKLKKELQGNVLATFPRILENESVAVHFRGTDFHNHLRWLFPKGIVLSRQYYQRSIQRIKEFIGQEPTFYLFSDEPNTIRDFFAGERYFIHEGSAYEAWTGLSMCKNIIQSNSSFCWTASLYNKKISIQPKGGYNIYKSNLGCIPFQFYHPNSIIISSV